MGEVDVDIDTIREDSKGMVLLLYLLDVKVSMVDIAWPIIFIWF